MIITVSQPIPQTVTVSPPQMRLTQFNTPLAPLVQLGIIGIPGPQGPPSDQITVSDTPPTSPELYDLWVDLS